MTEGGGGPCSNEKVGFLQYFLYCPLEGRSLSRCRCVLALSRFFLTWLVVTPLLSDGTQEAAATALRGGQRPADSTEKRGKTAFRLFQNHNVNGKVSWTLFPVCK